MEFLCQVFFHNKKLASKNFFLMLDVSSNIFFALCKNVVDDFIYFFLQIFKLIVQNLSHLTVEHVDFVVYARNFCMKFGWQTLKTCCRLYSCWFKTRCVIYKPCPNAWLLLLSRLFLYLSFLGIFWTFKIEISLWPLCLDFNFISDGAFLEHGIILEIWLAFVGLELALGGSVEIFGTLRMILKAGGFGDVIFGERSID